MSEIDDKTDRDPALLTTMTALVEAMVLVAGSNRRLSELTGVSDGTVRNFRGGVVPKTSLTTAVELDTWAARALPDHPAAGEPGSLTDLLARWQGRPAGPALETAIDAGTDADAGADAPSEAAASDAGHEPPPDRGPRSRRARTALAALAALLLVGVTVGVTLVCVRLAGGPEPSGVAGVDVDRDLALDDDNFCSWTLGSDPVPLVSADPLVMRVDARCNAPAEPDPVKDVGTSVYTGPTNDDPEEKVGTIRSGNTFVPECWTRSGDFVEDASEARNRSSIWIRSAQPAGFVPDVNVGGGYTGEQLDALGLEAC